LAHAGATSRRPGQDAQRCGQQQTHRKRPGQARCDARSHSLSVVATGARLRFDDSQNGHVTGRRRRGTQFVQGSAINFRMRRSARSWRTANRATCAPLAEFSQVRHPIRLLTRNNGGSTEGCEIARRISKVCAASAIQTRSKWRCFGNKNENSAHSGAVKRGPGSPKRLHQPR
jgi:hypothetical protein